MSNIREDAQIVSEFAKITANRFKDVMRALPALVPQSEEDKILFKKGLEVMSEIVSDIENASSVREYGKYIDIDKVIRDFDSESIRTLDTKINSSARNVVRTLSDMADEMTPN